MPATFRDWTDLDAWLAGVDEVLRIHRLVTDQARPYLPEETP